MVSHGAGGTFASARRDHRGKLHAACACDAASGRDYFWDAASGETAWELPGAAPGAAVDVVPAASATDADAAGLSNEALLVLFTDYILTPKARFDYPSPSSEFMV